MASIKRRPRADGSTSYRVMFRIDGALLGDSFPTLLGAEEYKRLVEERGGAEAREILAARNTDRPTVLLKDWLRDHIDRLTGVEDGTRKDYRAMVKNHIAPKLGDYPLEVIDRRRLEEWVNELAPTMAGKTLRNVHALLSAGLNRAVYEGLVPANLAKGVRLPEPDHNRQEMVILTPNEFVALLDAVPAYWRPLVLTLVGTGMRWGEATALAAGSVDLDAATPTIRIQRAWKRTGLSVKKLGPPKTRKGRRTISLTPSLTRTLRPLVEGKAADAYVFTGPRGGAVSHTDFYRAVWQPAVLKANDEDRAAHISKQPRIHDLRHTHASWMLGAGRPITTVQRRLGHESIQTTVDTYGHAMPDDLRGDAAAIEEALAGALPVAYDPEGDLPAPLAVAGLVPDVERGEDAGPVGDEDSAEASEQTGDDA